MGKKGKWFDAVQRILSTSEPDPVEADAKVTLQQPERNHRSLNSYEKNIDFMLLTRPSQNRYVEGGEAERQAELQEDMAVRQIAPVRCFRVRRAGAGSGGPSASTGTVAAARSATGRGDHRRGAARGDKVRRRRRASGGWGFKGWRRRRRRRSGRPPHGHHAEGVGCAFGGGHRRHQDPGGLQGLYGKRIVAFH
jgi:hypothetical protein